MVGAKKKKSSPNTLPQFKIGGIYHAAIFTDKDRHGHYVIIAGILSATEVKVHLCTSSRVCASKGSIERYGLLGGEETYILTKPEIIPPTKIGQFRHLIIDQETASELGIDLT